jgi:uncharacterized caspase-like protein
MKKILYSLLFAFIFQATFAQKATTYAVIIGVADYQNENVCPDLTYTVPDAQKVYTFLKSSAGGAVPANHIRFLIDKKATKANIMKEMDYIFKFAKPQDRVIFYYSGHGGNGFFCPTDIGVSNNTMVNALSHDEVKDAFKKCKARTKLCIADACFAGSIKSVNRSLNTKSYIGLEDKSAGIAVIMASKSTQTSGEDPKLGQGIFSYFMVQGLAGKSDSNRDKVVTIKELFTYVWKNVKVYTKNKQVPILFSNTFTMPVAYLK